MTGNPRTLVFALAVGAACDRSDGNAVADAHRDADCTIGRQCTDGEVCISGDQRCECAEHGSNLVCESIACPETRVEPGTPCTEPGLTCDPDFEFQGLRCTAPENVFVECLPGGTIDSRCPFELPLAGSPCCWTRFDLDPCTYSDDPGGLWTCTSNHWYRADAQ